MGKNNNLIPYVQGKTSQLWATLHTRLEARDHRLLRSLIGRKARDWLSSLHSRTRLRAHDHYTSITLIGGKAELD